MFCAFPRSIDRAGQLDIDLGEPTGAPSHHDVTPHGYVHRLSERQGSRNVIETTFPGGAAMNYISDGQTSFAQVAPQTGNQVTAIFRGSIDNWDDIRDLYDVGPVSEDEGPAHLLIALYLNGFCDAYGDPSDQPATCFGAFEGEFAFVLYDSSVNYLVAARSADASVPMCWGVGHEHPERMGLPIILSTDKLGVQELCCGAADFPMGCFFQSTDGLEKLQAFIRPRHRDVRVQPRVNSKGNVCGLLYKTESGADLTAQV